MDAGGGLEGGDFRHVDGWWVRGSCRGGGIVLDELGVVQEGSVVGEVVHVHRYSVDVLACQSRG